MKKIKVDNQQGQSTLEFLFGFIVALSFLILFFSFSLNTARGYLVHFASFMAARSYLVYDEAGQGVEAVEASAAGRAQEVFDRYLKGLEDAELSVNPPGPNQNPVFVGVQAIFNQSFSLPGVFGASKGIELRSDSFLGREPGQACLARVCAMILSTLGGAGVDQGICPSSILTTAYDNGC